MNVVSVCSSVGGLDLGLHRAGHTTVLFCEADKWRRTILNRHFPGVPVHPDLEALTADDCPPCDLLAGGTPCQNLSVAGNRAGLAGDESRLFWDFAQLRIDLYDKHGCAWSLWENVAGALSSEDGRDFAQVLAAHVGADVTVPAGGWPSSGLAVGPWGTAEWRLLDAQFFGVPQRRRRVFVVGHLGAERAVEVLSDGARGPRDSAASGSQGAGATTRPARRADGARVAHTLTANGFDASEDGTGRGTPIVAAPLLARAGKGVDSDAFDGQIVVASALDRMRGGADDNDAQARHIVTAFHMTQYPISGPVSPALGTDAQIGVAFAENQRGELVESSVAHALSVGGGKPGQGYAAARTSNGVRRLTPTECERLMSWPDGWTLPDGPSLADAPQSWPQEHCAPLDPQPDGRRYSACGDGVVAHCAEWIGLGFAGLVGGEA